MLGQSGAPRGSLYHYFPGGKESSPAEALRTRVGADRGGDPCALRVRGLRPLRQLRAYGEQTSARLRATDFREGCPVGNTVLEASVLSPALRVVCDEGLRSWEAVIADALVDGGVERRRDAFGTFVVATFEGALLVARGRRSTAPVDDAAEQLAKLAEAMLNRSAG